MNNILSLREWEPVIYKLPRAGGDLTMELRHMKRHEIRPVSDVVVKLFREMGTMAKAADGEQQRSWEKAEALAKVYAVIPEEQLREWFKTGTQKIGLMINGLQATGEQLYEYADNDLVFFILTNLVRISGLNELEGKGSGSPSTSSPVAPATDAGASPAPSIASEGGPTPSTATPTPTESSLSSELESETAMAVPA